MVERSPELFDRRLPIAESGVYLDVPVGKSFAHEFSWGRVLCLCGALRRLSTAEPWGLMARMPLC